MRVAVRAAGDWEADVDETEGVLVDWFAREGRSVDAGDTLCEIQIEKVSVDVRAPVAGTLDEVLVREDDAFEVGETLGWIRSE
jgi:pyruvate/2-oxoglutarate dehydrogenase complex dihydrolipoamide acyltransferase (E2) component